MDEKQEKLYRDIKEFKQILKAGKAKELPGWLGCFLQIVVVIAATVIVCKIRFLDAYPDIHVISALAFIVLALVVTGLLLKRPSARTNAMVRGRATELGYVIRRSGRGRRYAVPVTDEMKQALLQCAFMQDYCLIYCRGCGKYIEPCDLVLRCSRCSRWFHAECVDESNTCVYCITGTAVPEKTEKSFAENEERTIFFAFPGSCPEIYPPYGIALESADSIEMDDYSAANCSDFR